MKQKMTVAIAKLVCSEGAYKGCFYLFHQGELVLRDSLLTDHLLSCKKFVLDIISSPNSFKHTTDSSLPVSTTLLKSLMCYSEANFKAYCPHRWLASGPNPKLRTFS
ncbi:hypothetical protein CDAR_585852 [Caerostris darwini]|uniref:Uncharacterized protein n=1 Tax=Caerostris darwini TaxID=1538125 RepID=A0AAV4TLT1_9ARAC|nr:hypothetical protein CDAR_585852 [Caerostris darwini]